MKKSWMTKLAGLLVMCLLVNNCIRELPMVLWASTNEDRVAATSSGDAETISQGDVYVQEEATPSPAPVPTIEPEVGSSTEQESILKEQETVSDGDSLFGEPFTLMSLSKSAGGGLPTTAEEYVASTLNTFYINTYEEFLAMQTLCDVANGFYGKTLIIASPPSVSAETKGVWDIASLDGFTGIGTASVPFQGTLYCDYDAGVRLKTDTPLFAYLGEGAVVRKLTIETAGASAVIAENISGAVTISDIVLYGTVANNGGAAGIIAANLVDGSNVTVTGVTVGGNGIRVSGIVAGGIAGTVGKDVTVVLGDGVTLGSSSSKIIVDGSLAAGSYFGTITGDMCWNIANEGKLFVKAQGNTENSYAGHIAGKLLPDANGAAALSFTGGNSVTVDVYSAGSCGGLVGLCETGTIISLPESGFSVNGTLQSYIGYAGGYIGVMNASEMELKGATITGQAYVGGSCVGGIVGSIVGGKVTITDATVNGTTLSGSSYVAGIVSDISADAKVIIKNIEVACSLYGTKKGGIIGKVTESAVELQGVIDTKNISMQKEDSSASIVSEIKESLIYFSEHEGINSEGTSQHICAGGDNPTYVEVSKYEGKSVQGGVFRNQAVGAGKLIGDGTIEQVGVVNNTITKSGDWYKMGSDSVADATVDMETLAIVLFTGGKYGSEAFGGATEEALLKSYYTLSNNADISYKTTGIVTINSPMWDNKERAFSGKLQGATESITITQSNIIYNGTSKHVGVFSALGGNAEFSNLIIDGECGSVAYAGGLAYQTFGDSLTLRNFQMRKTYAQVGNEFGGVLAFELSENLFRLNVQNITLASYINKAGNDAFGGFIMQMGNAQVSMKDVELGGFINANASETMGGFLGKTWSDVSGTVENVSVLEGTRYKNAKGAFGVLLEEVTTSANSRLTLKNVSLNNLTVDAAQKEHCSLLIQNAENMILEVIDYNSAGCTVNNPGNYFDEIAAISRKEGRNYLGAPTGIISIHVTDTTYHDVEGNCFPKYHYENKADGLEDMKNPYTMYFYDVFQRLGKMGTCDGELNTVSEALLWDIMHYAMEGNVWNTFNAYWSTPYPEYKYIWKEYPSDKEITFGGKLDLSTISFYPVTNATGSYDGKDVSTIISFDASKMKDWKLSNTSSSSQHYGLNAGLFYNLSGHLTAKNFTLTGNVANLGIKSGALVSGSSGMSQGWVLNLVLKDLWVNGYDGSHGVGLLISNIPGTSYEEEKEAKAQEVNFKYVKMTGYTATDESKAAAALIGSVGGEDVYNLVLEFNDMVIADDSDANPGAQAHNGDVLAHASFICNYAYTTDDSINKGSGLYLFEDKDCPGNVTYGSEINDDTEFSNTTAKVKVALSLDPANYKPYVCDGCTNRDIEVNPKTGDILKGCGTYEDPYIIEDVKQFLTLYRYINDTLNDAGAYRYQTFYKGWQIIAPGNDSTFCTTKHRVTKSADGTLTGDGVAEVKAFGKDSDFPTPEELSRAYYRLGADIDLTGLSGTYELIANEFVGFGTETNPFVGVWYGRDEDGTTIHSITLPNKEADATYATYGFIQYAKGAVVKDLKLKMKSGTVEETLANGSTVSVEYRPTVIEGVGGGVIASILGGDNIIDNVTVEVSLTSKLTTSVVGGYVGVVKKGGLILRNVSDATFASFNWANATSKATWQMLYGKVAGKVEDGYIVCEGDENGDVLCKLTTRDVGNYDIVNIGASAFADKVQVAYTAENGSLTFSIPGEGALQLMAMALNSDSLNVRPSDYEKYTTCGYTEKARCRKAAYSDIGCATAVEDYVAAAKYDNVMSYDAAADTAYAYPYLYDYIGIGVNYVAYFVGDAASGYSILNPAASIASKDYHVEWVLAENGTYDMSKFGKAFVGIGALYQTGDGYGGTFHGDFDGNESTVNLAMTRYAAPSDAATVWRAGLFNTLYHAQAAYKETADYGKDESNPNVQSCFVLKDFKVTGSIEAKAVFSENEVTAGGVVSYIGNGNYLFSGVTCESLNITVISNGGGMIGNVGSYYSHIYLDNCASKNQIVKGIYAAGGLIANSNAMVLKIVDTEVDGLQQSGYNETSINNAGGMVGNQNNADGMIILKGTAEKPLKVTNSSMFGKVTAGGLVGYANSTLLVQNAYCEGNKLKAYRQMGGIIAHAAAGNNENNGTIQNTGVKNVVTEEIYLCDTVATGIGGIVGRNERTLSISGTSVTGTITNGAYDCRLAAATNKARTGSMGVGGLVGLHGSGTLSLSNCNVDTVYIFGDVENSVYDGKKVSVSAGGLVGWVENPVVLDGTMTISNSEVIVPLYEETPDQSIMVAGGAFGYVFTNGKDKYGQVTAADEKNYAGLTAVSTDVTGRYAGGLIGYVNNPNTLVKLTGIVASGGNVSSDDVAGGVFGYTTGDWHNLTLGEEANNVITEMNISGKKVGGVIGELEMWGRLLFHSVYLTDNTIVAKQSADNEEYSAGGVIGNYISSDSGTCAFEDIYLQNNTVVCEAKGDSLSATEVDCLAVGGFIGRIDECQSVNHVTCDNFSLAENNIIGVRKVSATENTNPVQLVTKVSVDSVDTYQLAAPTIPGTVIAKKDYEALEILEEGYSYYVGNMVGIVQSTAVQLYILRSVDTNNRFVTPVLTSNPPVVDVGRNSADTVDAYRQYVHIIYGAPVADAKDPSRNLADMRTEVVEKTASDYAGTESLAVLLAEYRLSKTAVDMFTKAYQTSYTFSAGKSIDFPILVWKAEYGTIQEFMENIVDVMTNVAGASASDIDGNYFQVSSVQKLCNGTEVSDSTATPSIVVSNTNRETTYRSADYYDGLTEDGTKLSYTELTFTYGWYGHQKTFKLPVFVEEPILYGVHTKLMEGKVVDVEAIKSNGVSDENASVIMANDSDYTLLMEYTYGKARKNMPNGTVVDKVFSVSAETAKYITPGTKLMLIDVLNGGKAYYYTVQAESSISQLKFTDFKDSAGNAYTNVSINKLEDVTNNQNGTYTDINGHELSEVGVEQFLLTVLASSSAADKKEVYTIEAGIQIDDEGLASRFDETEGHKKSSKINVTSVPGLNIQFTGKGTDGGTNIEGTISREGGLQVEAAFEIRAKDGLYWAEKNNAASNTPLIDSSNAGKYLDIAFYLRDTSGNRAKLPTGTNFSYRVGEGTYSEKKVIPEESVFYYYKDIRDTFAREDFLYYVGSLNADATVSVEFLFDFSGADMSNITKESYNAWLELLRTSDADYPMGSDNKLDSHSEPVNASAIQQLGFAIKATRLEQLAINTYPAAASKDTIKYSVMFEFGDLLKKSGGIGTEALLERWSGFNYTVTYQIYRKNESGNYVEYRGNDIVLKSSGGVVWDDALKVYVPANTSSTNGSMEVLYRFSKEQLADELVIFENNEVTIATDKLTETLSNLTNYKIIATLEIAEPGSSTAPAEDTSDFFIYTVTRLKYDL